MKFCEECGAELNDDAKFCDECGSAVADKDINSNIVDSNSKNDKKNNSILLFVIIIIIGILVGIYFVTQQKNKSQDDNITTELTTECTTEVTTTEVQTEEQTTEEVTTEITTEENTTEQIVEEIRENIYYNELFGYSMLIPEGFEIVQEFADNDVKDGVMLSDGSAQIEIRGTDYITINTASDVMDWAYGTVTWSDLGDNYCCYSYDLNGALGYYGCYFDGNIEVYFNFQYIIDFEKDSYPAIAEQLCEYVMNGNVVK